MAVKTLLLLFYLIFVTSQCKILNGYLWDSHIDCSKRELANTYGLRNKVIFQPPKSLDYSYNELTKVADDAFEIPELYSLEEVNLSFNKIEYVGPSAFSGMFSLKLLDLSNNLLETLSFDVGSKLIKLNVSWNRLDDQLTVYSPTLEILDVSHNAISKLDSGQNTPNIKHFNISYNKFQTLPYELLWNFHLTSLQIRGNNIHCNEATTHLLVQLGAGGVDVTPTCPAMPGTTTTTTFSAPKIATEDDLMLRPLNNVKSIDELPVETTINQQDLLNLNIAIFFTQLAIIALLIFIIILLIIFRVKDSKKNKTRIVLPLEETEDDPPPPPYRSNSSGFII